MIQKVLLPKLGQTMEEATVETWRVKEGDVVKKGDVLLEITTDKATLEVESFIAGTVRKILAEPGAVLPVNTVLALVGDPNDPLPDDLASLAAPAKSDGAPKEETSEAAAVAEEETAPVPAAMPGRLFVSPRARRKAENEKVSLALLRGSGPDGRIVEKDVDAYLQKRAAVKATPTALKIAFERGVDVLSVKGSGPGGKITKEDALAAPVAAAPSVGPGAGRRVELSAMRRIVAERMTQSKREAPHFYLIMDIDMTAAAALRRRLNDGGDVRIGFHDLLIRACAKALVAHPKMNVSWAGDAILQRSEVNVSLAVALEEGLIVPVVKNADRLGLKQIALESKRLIDRARRKKLTPDEYEGGCLTISNLGMYDVDAFLPVINPGESGILGVGRIVPKPVVLDGGIHVRSIMTACLSADHRGVDGAIAAEFLKAVKDLLEAPEPLAE